MRCAVLLLVGAACAAPPHPRPAVDSVAQQRQLRQQARAAYRAKDWATCAALFARIHKAYDAAACQAQAGQRDAAFASLARAIDDGLHGNDPAADDDLAPLHDDPRWATTLTHIRARAAERADQRNAELARLYAEDQADRNASSYEQIDWSRVQPRDEARRHRVAAILKARGARTAEDYFAAAMIYQHGESPEDIQRAHDLAVQAVTLDPAHDQARWLAAAAEDRKLMYEHKPQKWGTQFKKVDGRWIVWPVDPAITDAQRDEWNVPPLAHAEQYAAEMNAKLKK